MTINKKMTARTMDASTKKITRGFTLIELLVVIAIIGLLSAIVLAALNTAQERGRDAKRLSDLQQVQNALEEYANDNGGSYPQTTGVGGCAGNGGFCGTCDASSGHTAVTGSLGWVPNLAPTYISVLPSDPLPNPPTGCYTYISNGTDYMLEAYGTVESYTSASNPKKNPDTPTYNSFAFYTSGAVGGHPNNW